MLSDNDREKNVKSPRRRSPNAVQKRWSDSQKIEAVTTFLMLGGSPTLTAATLKIPLPTFHGWRRTEWWKDTEKQLRLQERLTLSNSLQKLVDKSMEVVADRLENGDWIYDQKTGELRRKPVQLRDAHKVAESFIDRKQKLETLENFVVAQENIQEKLSKLAKSFEEFANKQEEKPKIEVTDVMFISADEYQEEGDDYGASDEGDSDNATDDEYSDARENVNASYEPGWDEELQPTEGIQSNEESHGTSSGEQ